MNKNLDHFLYFIGHITTSTSAPRGCINRNLELDTLQSREKSCHQQEKSRQGVTYIGNMEIARL